MVGMGRIWRGEAVNMTIRMFIVTAMLAYFQQTANATERKFLMGSFQDIVIDGDMHVNIITGKSPSAKASGDRRMLDSLKLVRVGKTMTVRIHDIINNEKGVPISEPLIITLTNREVRNITVRGNAKLSVSEINQPYGSTIRMNGGGEINVGKMEVDNLAITLFGNGKLNIASGAADDSRVEIRGAAEFMATGLKSRVLRLTHDGNATTKITVAEKSDIFNDGSGSITIGGTGLCFIRKAGMAAIDCQRGK